MNSEMGCSNLIRRKTKVRGMERTNINRSDLRTLPHSQHHPWAKVRALTIVFFYIALLPFQEVETVKLASLKIPKYAIRAHAVRLECHYDLEGEALYSVKWYKDDREFYRFLPGEDPPAHTFNLPGLPVELRNSTDTVVLLGKVDFNSSGIYRCEISGEAPSFRTVVESSQMIVVDLPDDGPHIDGGRPRYAIGDIISVNCSSTRARPGAKLTWQVNGNQAPDEALRRYHNVQHEDELETSILGLHFKIRSHHFINRMLKIKCIATIEDFYWRTNEENVLENHYERSVQEGKSTYNPGKRDASGSSSVRDYCHYILIITFATLFFPTGQSPSFIPFILLTRLCEMRRTELPEMLSQSA